MDKILLEYIWLDGNESQQIRSKIKVVDAILLADFEQSQQPDNLPMWNFDGSSTLQAEGKNSDCLLKPVKVIFHPFHQNGYVVFCEVFDAEGSPHKTNTRHSLVESAKLYESEEALFGIEQEYTFYTRDGKPLGFYSENMKPQGDYYCGTGANNITGREIAESHLQICLALGIQLSGINAEVMPGQWEFQVGPLPAVEVSDQLWLARWILLRVAEKYGVVVNFDPKPVREGDWNGSGCHTNFSTGSMRQPGGMKYIKEAIAKLELTHKEHMEHYGKDNQFRMTGKHETCDFNTFKSGNSDRGASIRIPINVKISDYGYFEDRRPAANMDPYKVCQLLLRSVCAN